MKPIQNNLVLELHVPDFEQVKTFYSYFGFEVILEEPIGEELGYLVLKRSDPLGESIINFYGGDEQVSHHSFFKDFPEDEARGYGVEITIPVTDIEEFYNDVLPYVKHSVAQELTLKRWGKKDFRIVDPFGFYLRFTELVDWGQ